MKKVTQVWIILGFALICLDSLAQKRQFLRVFDIAGRKISKGIYSGSTDSTLILMRNKKESVIPVSQIQTIKLKRAFGAGIWKGAAIGGGFYATLGALTADPNEFLGYTAAEGAITGLVGGAVIGGAIGGIIDAVQKRPTFDINGDPQKWKRMRDILETLK